MGGRAWVRFLVLGLLAGAGAAGCAGPDRWREDDLARTRALAAELGQATAGLVTALTALEGRIQRGPGGRAGARDCSTRARGGRPGRPVGSRLAALQWGLGAVEVELGRLQTRLAAAQTAGAALAARLGALEARAAAAEERVRAMATRGEATLAAFDARQGTLERALRALETTVAGLADQVVRLEAVGTEGTIRPPPRPAPQGAPFVTLQQAVERLRRGELVEAIVDLEQLIARDPTHPAAADARFWIGEAYLWAREFEEAAAHFRQALDLAPGGSGRPQPS